MIVYGDPSSSHSLGDLAKRLARGIRRGFDSRALLIQAGMLEQAAEDAGLGAPYREVTDALAQAFLEPGRPLPTLPVAVDATVVVKLPEGFAFYGLYPEAYAVAAERWRRDHPGTRCVVIGVRSIGTTLSAVVAASLRAGGMDAHRLTVRPTGHPFVREANLPALNADWALVVDEGPGLSGSSMASVAEAAVRAGIARERVVFLPGHGGEPGAQASEAVRVWWRKAPRIVVSTEELRWKGRTLEETLFEHTEGAHSFEDLSEGRWRGVVYNDPADWPAVATAFERRKFLIVRHDGSAVLWKFVGLTVPGTVLGFTPAPWVEGEPLRREDATLNLIAQVGRHIAAVAGPPLAAKEARAARTRLEEMLRVNAAEADVLLPRLPFSWGDESLSAGDYRLTPCDWRRLADGGIAKAGRIAPTLDHTVVGRQPLAWDVAGAMVEWDLNDPSGLPSVADLGFYRAAYAAFRMGQCAMFAGSDEEGERLRRDAAFYLAVLKRTLGDYAGSEGSSPV